MWDSWRSRSKAKDQRELLEDRLDIVEAEVDRLRNKYEPGWEALSEKESEPEKYSWYNPAGWWARTEPAQAPAIDVAKEQKASVSPTTAANDASKVGGNAAATTTEQQKPTKEDLVKKQVLNTPPERIDSVVAANKSR